MCAGRVLVPSHLFVKQSNIRFAFLFVHPKEFNDSSITFANVPDCLTHPGPILQLRVDSFDMCKRMRAAPALLRHHQKKMMINYVHFEVLGQSSRRKYIRVYRWADHPITSYNML